MYLTVSAAISLVALVSCWGYSRDQIKTSPAAASNAPQTRLKISEAKFGEIAARSGVIVQLSEVTLETPALLDTAGEALPAESSSVCLVIRGSIKAFTTRSFGDFRSATETALVTADTLERIPSATLPDGARLAGNNYNSVVNPTQPSPFVLAFEIPPDGEDLILELDGATCGLPSEGFRFQIPREKVRDVR